MQEKLLQAGVRAFFKRMLEGVPSGPAKVYANLLLKELPKE